MQKIVYFSLVGLIAIISADLYASSGINVDDVSVKVAERIVTVDCDFTYEVDNNVESALSNGVEIAFVVDVELVEENIYWLNRNVGSFSYVFFLKYHALSQQFILRDHNSEQSFPDLYSAFYFQSRIQDIEIANVDSLDLDQKYFIKARARLASEMLPLPLRIKSYFSSEWRPTSGWTIWPM
ncbi:MAG: DUF4390 domain-containing protein [Pseudomonadota bacterium]